MSDYEEAKTDILSYLPDIDLNNAQQVVALDEYINAYVADKNAIQAYDQFDASRYRFTMSERLEKDSQLRREGTKTRKHRKRVLRSLLDLMHKKYEWTSTDEEDELA